MSSLSLTSITTLTSCSSSPDTLPSNVATPGWTSYLFFSTECAELWLPKYTPLSSGPDFPTLSPLSFSLPVVISSPPPTIEIPPILSVDVPVHCHHLHSFLSPTEHATLVTAVMDLHLAVPFNHYFDDSYPFEALYKVYLQVERLGVIVNSPFITHNSITPIVKHITHDVQTRL